MRLARFASAVLVLVTAVSLSWAQDTAPAGQSKSDPGRQPKLKTTSFQYDFGTVNAGEPQSHAFVFKNEGTADLLIKSVAPS